MLDYRLTVHDLIKNALTVPSGADGDSQLSRDLQYLAEAVNAWATTHEGQIATRQEVDKSSENSEPHAVHEVATRLIKTIPRFGGVADRDALINHLREWAKSQGVIL